MAVTIISPHGDGVCLPDSWRQDNANSICPKLMVFCQNITSGVPRPQVRYSGTWYGTCGGSNPYFRVGSRAFYRKSFLNNATCTWTASALFYTINFVEVDVWKMHRDAVWTSSIAFDVGVGHTLAASRQELYIVSGAEEYVADGDTCTCTSKTVTTDATECPSPPTITATLTVYDDGTFALT